MDMNRKEEKQSNELAEKEDKLDKLIGVRDWIKNNPAEFTVDGARLTPLTRII
jgi:hypothetical protein